jgi:hypothetical protein
MVSFDPQVIYDLYRRRTTSRQGSAAVTRNAMDRYLQYFHSNVRPVATSISERKLLCPPTSKTPIIRPAIFIS